MDCRNCAVKQLSAVKCIKNLNKRKAKCSYYAVKCSRFGSSILFYLIFRNLSRYFWYHPLEEGCPSNFHENTRHLINFLKSTGHKGKFKKLTEIFVKEIQDLEQNFQIYTGQC